MAGERLWTIGFVNLLAFDVIYQFGAYMTNTVISVYAVTLGATYAVAGLMAGLNPGASMASRPFTGLIADAVSKKTLLVASAVLFLAATLGCALFESLALIGICRVLQGVSFALRSVCVVALVARVVPESRLHSGMGWMGLSSVVSTAVGPLISQQVGTVVGYRGSFLIASGLLAIGVMLALAFRRPPGSDDGRCRRLSLHQLRQAVSLSSFIYRPNISFTVMAGLSGVPQGASIALIILAADHRGIGGATLFFTAYALAALMGRPLMGRLADVLGARRIVAPLFAVEFASVVVLGFMADTAMIVIGGFLLGVGQGSLYPVLQAESVAGVPPDAMGRAANTFYIGPDINMCLSPIIGSILLGSFGVGALYAFGGVAVALAFALFVWRIRNSQTA